MAELLKNIPTNLTEYPNSFKRQGAFPLEAYSVFYTMDAAIAYAASNPISYVGQTLAVVTSHTEVIEEVETSIVDDVTFYIIADATGALQEVGKATNGDGNTITLNDGVLSLTGFEAAPSATLPQKSPVYKKDEEGNDTDVVDHYELKWVAIDAIVEGDTNTKTVVAASDGETHVKIELARDEDNDTNTYKISLDLSAYATEAAVGNAINAAKEELQGQIDAEKTARETAIGAAAKAESVEGAGDAVEATGLYKVIEEAEARAKAYADAKDATNVYDDAQVKEDITDHETRIGAIESALGDESHGILKTIADNTQAISDEASAREQGDEDTLEAAKDFTNTEISGIQISIEKKTIDKVESDYIVIKNNAGTEVASVNAARFIKDGMLDTVEYNKDSKILTLTWNTDAGKNATEIDLNDLIDTYKGSEHIIVETDGTIKVADDVALDSDLTSLETALTTLINTKLDATAVNKAIDDKITAANLDQYAKASDVDTALAEKADAQTVTDLATEVAKKADAETVNTALNNKVDTTTYTGDMAKVAKTEDVNSQFNAVGTRIGEIEADVEANAKAIEDLASEASTTYATKDELKATDDKAVSNTNSITNLTNRLDGIVAQGGEPNTINTIKVNGVAQTIDTEKAVDITVPVISNTSVSDLKDGQDLVNRVSTAESTLTSLGTTVQGQANGIVTLSNRLQALETEVKMEEESRIDALEATVNGVEGVSDGLVGKVAALGTEVAGLKTADTEIRATLSGKANAGEVYTKGETDTAIENAIKEIPAVDLAPYAKQADLLALTTTVNEGLAARVTSADFEAYKTETATLIGTKANAADVYTKTEANDTFVAEANFEERVDARLNTLIDGANSTDTITNVTNLIEFVNNNAGEIAQLVTDVQDNTTAIESNTSKIDANNAAIKANTSAIEALTTALETNVAGATVHESTEISVSARTGEGETGVALGIKEVNVNKLVQTEGEVIILNGGSASV